MKRIKLLILLGLTLIIVASSTVCPICGRIGTTVGGQYFVCPLGHTWK